MSSKSDCPIPVDPCNTLNPCFNDGTCTNNSHLPQLFSCSCSSNYTGIFCQIDKRICQSNTCFFNGLFSYESNINHLRSYFRYLYSNKSHWLSMFMYPWSYGKTLWKENWLLSQCNMSKQRPMSIDRNRSHMSMFIKSLFRSLLWICCWWYRSSTIHIEKFRLYRYYSISCRWDFCRHNGRVEIWIWYWSCWIWTNCNAPWRCLASTRRTEKTSESVSKLV